MSRTPLRVLLDNKKGRANARPGAAAPHLNNALLDTKPREQKTTTHKPTNQDLQTNLPLDGECSVDEERAEALAAWAKPRRATTRVVVGELQSSLSEAAERMSSGDWDGATAKHFVALWAVCHERVYGVSALRELDGMGWRSAVRAAANVLRAEFGSDAAQMAEYVRWCWVREQGREQWRRENGASRGRIEWRHQFAYGRLLSDWRVDVARRKGE